MERRDLDAVFHGTPHAGHVPVDEDGREDVAIDPDHVAAQVRRDDPGAVRVRQQRAVPHRHQPRRRGRALAGELAIGHVQQHGAVRPLVLHERVAQRLDRLPYTATRDHRELSDIGDRGRPEPLEIAHDEVPEGRRDVAGPAQVARSEVRRRLPERPRAPGWCQHEWRVPPERPPHAPPGLDTQPLIQPGLDVRVGARL